MTDRRSFLASLLCLPAALKGVGDMPPAIHSCSDGEYVTAWDPREYVEWHYTYRRVGPPPGWFYEPVEFKTSPLARIMEEIANDDQP